MPDTPKPKPPVHRRSRYHPTLGKKTVAERLETETLRLAANRPELLTEMRKWAEGNEHEGEQQYWQLVLDAALTAMAVDARKISVLHSVAHGDGFHQGVEYRVSPDDEVWREGLHTLDELNRTLSAATELGRQGTKPVVEFRTHQYANTSAWQPYVEETPVVADDRTKLIDSARADTTFAESPLGQKVIARLVADAQTIADQDIEIARLARIESAEHAAWMEECRQKLDDHATYLAEHDEKPDMYLGHLQPGASPSFYGPDDVVVDGDWLAQLEVNYTFATARVEELETGRS